MKRLVCPGCTKKGVTLRLGGEDWWTCRYCGWTAASDGYDTVDVKGREALRLVNPDNPAAPMPEPAWALEEPGDEPAAALPLTDHGDTSVVTYRGREIGHVGYVDMPPGRFFAMGAAPEQAWLGPADGYPSENEAVAAVVAAHQEAST